MPSRRRNRAIERRIIAALEDRRRYHPLGRYAPPQALPKDAARVVVPVKKRRHPRHVARAISPGVRAQMDAAWPTERLAFKVPRRVSMCVKPKTRRELILASGRGGGGHRPPKPNPWSKVEC